VRSSTSRNLSDFPTNQGLTRSCVLLDDSRAELPALQQQTFRTITTREVQVSFTRESSLVLGD
jgi:hypothetical protein